MSTSGISENGLKSVLVYWFISLLVGFLLPIVYWLLVIGL